MREQLPARLTFGQGGVGIVADRREALINVVVEGNPEIVGREVLLAHEARTFSGFPMMLGDHLLGVLAVSGREGQPLDAADEVVLRALVGQAAVAIQNARLYEDARTHEIEARRALEELRRTQEQLVRMEKLRALGEMASGVAHDFNNVLAVILGRVQLLQRKLEDPTFRRWLAIVEQAALDGAQTVRQIQEFTRVRRDQPTQTVEVNQAIRDAVEMTRARWQDESQSRGVPIRLTLDLAAVPSVDGQPSELREVLTNLILNAVDALPRGGDIRIATRERAGRVEVIVADTGRGDVRLRPAADLRALLLDQGPRRDRPRARHGLRHRVAARRGDPGGHRRGRGLDVHDPAPGGALGARAGAAGAGGGRRIGASARHRRRAVRPRHAGGDPPPAAPPGRRGRRRHLGARPLPRERRSTW